MADMTSHEAPAHHAAALPVRLPGKLQGRDKILGTIYNQLKTNQAVLISGPSGIGKTALAGNLAAAYAELPGGVLWLSVQNDSLESLIVRVGRAYGDEEIGRAELPAAMIGAVATLLTSHKPLIVLDGVHQASATTQFVRKCAPNLPVLIVSATPFDDWAHVPLTKLDTAAGAALLKVEGKLAETVSSADLEAVAQKLDTYPYALTLAAGTLAAQRLAPTDYSNLLGQIPNLKDITPAQAALTLAYRTTNPPLQGLLLLLGATYIGSASAELLSLISGAPIDHIESAMRILQDNRLVDRYTRYGLPVYALHEITYTFAQGFLKAAGRLDGTQAKVRESLLDYARRYSIDSPGAHNNLALEMEQLLHLARWCAEAGERDLVNQIVVNLTQAGSFVQTRGFVNELLHLRKLSSSQTSAFPAYPLLNDLPLSNAALDDSQDLLDASQDLDIVEASEQQVLPTTPALKHTERPEDLLANVLRDAPEALGGVLTEASAADDKAEDDISDLLADILDEAEAAADAAVDDLPGVGVDALIDHKHAAPEDVLDALADADDDEVDVVDDDLAAELEESDEDEAEAEPLLRVETALTPLQKLQAELRAAKHGNDRAREGRILLDLAELHLAEGEETEALASYGDALTAYEAANDRANMLTLLEKLAHLALRADSAGAANLYAKRGVLLAQELGQDKPHLALLVALGDARQLSGENAEAAQAFRDALALAQRLADEHQEAQILLRLGFAHLDNGEASEAASVWEQALKLFQKYGKRAAEGQAMGGLGSAYGELGRWEEAVRFHTSAFYIAREVKDTDEEALQLANLGYACTKANRLGEAVTRYRQALHLAFKHDQREEIVSNALDLARLLTQSRKHLSIAMLLVVEALKLDHTNRDLLRLKDKITQDSAAAQAEGIQPLVVSGSAQDYAANAYKLLDEG